MFAVMLAVGTSMSMAEFRAVSRSPAPVFAALAMQWLALPALGAALNFVLAPPPFVSMAVILIAVSPGGALSNAYTFLADANVELSVAITSVSTLLAVVTVPLLAGWWLPALGERADGSLLAVQLVATVLAPVILGMVAAARWPDGVARAQRMVRLVVLAGVVVILVAVFAQHGRAVFDNAALVIGITLLFTVTAAVMTAACNAALRLNRPDRWAMLFELSTRNLAVASLVGAAIGAPEVIAVAAVFLLVQTPVMLAATRLARGAATAT